MWVNCHWDILSQTISNKWLHGECVENTELLSWFKMMDMIYETVSNCKWQAIWSSKDRLLSVSYPKSYSGDIYLALKTMVSWVRWHVKRIKIRTERITPSSSTLVINRSLQNHFEHFVAIAQGYQPDCFISFGSHLQVELPGLVEKDLRWMLGWRVGRRDIGARCYRPNWSSGRLSLPDSPDPRHVLQDFLRRP